MIAKQLENYITFLRVLSNRLDEHFENQKEYIHCKEGCSHCCKNGQYPCTELEFEFLKMGFYNLPIDQKKQIVDNIIKLKQLQEKSEKFYYECPFLINDRCSVYNFRMIICRTFGLAYHINNDKTGKTMLKSPFCMEIGLNYSEVYDNKTKTFSMEKFKHSGYKQEPLAYNISTNFLKTEFGEKVMNIDFGEEKALIDWFDIST